MLYIGEVGVDLELCVHAHGNDVDPIMETPCNNNCPLDIISSHDCELELIPLQSWFRPYFLLDPISQTS